MHYSTILAALALPLMAAAAPAVDARQRLPPCSNIDRPCSCPAGTQFKNVTTYAVIGATAKDIGDVVNICKSSP